MGRGGGMIKYFLAILSGTVVGVVITGLLASEKLADLERENIHLEYDLERLKESMGVSG